MKDVKAIGVLFLRKRALFAENIHLKTHSERMHICTERKAIPQTSRSDKVIMRVGKETGREQGRKMEERVGGRKEK